MHILAYLNFKLSICQVSNSPSSVDVLYSPSSIYVPVLEAWIDYFKILLGQLKMSSLSQPGAEPVLLLLFEVLCVWWDGRVETVTGFSLF